MDTFDMIPLHWSIHTDRGIRYWRRRYYHEVPISRPHVLQYDELFDMCAEAAGIDLDVADHEPFSSAMRMAVYVVAVDYSKHNDFDAYTLLRSFPDPQESCANVALVLQLVDALHAEFKRRKRLQNSCSWIVEPATATLNRLWLRLQRFFAI
jgi:hypothetical protein